MNLRIAVVNLQSGIGITRGYNQYLTSGWRYLFQHAGHGVSGAGVHLASADVDLALVTEIDAGGGRARHPSQVDRLKAEGGFLYAHFFPTRRARATVNEGNAIFSSRPLLDPKRHRLSSSVNPRALGEATIVTDGVPITVFVAHLALRQVPRSVQFEEIAEIIRDVEGPVILGGDFNERDRTAFGLLEDIGLTRLSVPGYPSWSPQHELQALFVSEHFNVTGIATSTEPLFSDHLPLFVEATFTPSGIPRKSPVQHL